jgi:hypothetical protein
VRGISEQFAHHWIEAWNSHDIERVLEHYHPDVAFLSPTAERLLGNGHVVGIDKLRAYWIKGLEMRPALNFTLIRTFLGFQSIAIHYHDELAREVIESLIFDEDGQVVIGTGCYA